MMIRLTAPVRATALCFALAALVACDDTTPTASDAIVATDAHALAVANHAPTAVISTPLNWASYAQGTSVLFTGSGNDFEDGVLSGTSLVWTSNRDGQIGTGTSFTKSNLSVGVHTITITARDSKGATGSKARALTISAATSNQPPVASITAPAGGASFVQGASVTFTGTGTDPESGALTGSSLTWTSNVNGQIGTGTSFSTSSLAVGTHTITLTARDAQSATGIASRSITVTAPVNQAPTASITSPSAGASFVQGTSVAFAGSGNDPESGALSGASLTWTSSVNGQIGTGTSFSTSSLSLGTHTITLTARDAQNATGTATRSITVTAPPPPPPPSGAECGSPQPGWIWCDDFETNRLTSYFEYDNDGGDFARTAAVGKDGSYGMRAIFQAGEVGAGSIKLAFGRTPLAYFRPVDAGTADYREIYWRMYVRNQSGWTGGGGDKLSRATVFANSNWAQAAIGHVWSINTNYLGIDPASGTDAAGVLKTTAYNDFPNLRWLGAQQGTTPLFSSASVGQWYCVEAHMKLNDAGASNGVNELWINGTLQAQRTNLNWVGSFNAYGINAVFFENYWNAGSPVTQERYFDNIVVSTQRIGC